MLGGGDAGEVAGGGGAVMASVSASDALSAGLPLSSAVRVRA